MLGWDHLLLLLGFIILSNSARNLIVAITGFTIGHSVTLLVVGFDLFRLSAVFVEAMIAASLVLLAYEIRKSSNKSTVKNLLLLAVVFGLFHGMGFANTAAQLFEPGQQMILNLVAFNVGIEVGQILFVSLALMLLSIVRFERIRGWLSFGIGSLGSFYLISALA